jgi:hypothetical protein
MPYSSWVQLINCYCYSQVSDKCQSLVLHFLSHLYCVFVSVVLFFGTLFYDAFSATRPEVLILWGVPPGGSINPLGSASWLYEGHNYFEWNMGARWNIYFARHFAWLKYFTYRLVPILAPNYKQHILSPAKVRKVWYWLAELYVRSVCLNLFGWREVWHLWNILKEGASYKSLGTSELDYIASK